MAEEPDENTPMLDVPATLLPAKDVVKAKPKSVSSAVSAAHDNFNSGNTNSGDNSGSGPNANQDQNLPSGLLPNAGMGLAPLGAMNLPKHLGGKGGKGGPGKQGGGWNNNKGGWNNDKGGFKGGWNNNKGGAKPMQGGMPGADNNLPMMSSKGGHANQFMNQNMMLMRGGPPKGGKNKDLMPGYSAHDRTMIPGGLMGADDLLNAIDGAIGGKNNAFGGNNKGGKNNAFGGNNKGKGKLQNLKGFVKPSFGNQPSHQPPAFNNPNMIPPNVNPNMNPTAFSDPNAFNNHKRFDKTFSGRGSDREVQSYRNIWRKGPPGSAYFAQHTLEKIYRKLSSTGFSQLDIRSLEFSGFLEKYLWPHLEQDKPWDETFAEEDQKRRESKALANAGVEGMSGGVEGSGVDSRTSVGEGSSGIDSKGGKEKTKSEKKRETLKEIADDLDRLDDDKPSPRIPRPHVSKQHVMLIVIMFNEKFRDAVDGWSSVTDLETIFPIFFEKLLDLMSPASSAKKCGVELVTPTPAPSMKKTAQPKSSALLIESKAKNFDDPFAAAAVSPKSRSGSRSRSRSRSPGARSGGGSQPRKSSTSAGREGQHNQPQANQKGDKNQNNKQKNQNNKYNPHQQSLRHVHLSREELGMCIQFLITCFQSLEQLAIRKCVLKLVGLPLWMNLSKDRLDNMLALDKRYKKGFKAVMKRYNAGDEKKDKNKDDKDKSKDKNAVTNMQYHERYFLNDLLEDFFFHAERARNAPSGQLPPFFTNTMERFLEFLIDLLSQLPLRKLFRALLLDKHFVVRLQDFLFQMREKFTHQEIEHKEKAQKKNELEYLRNKHQKEAAEAQTRKFFQRDADGNPLLVDSNGDLVLDENGQPRLAPTWRMVSDSTSVFTTEDGLMQDDTNQKMIADNINSNIQRQQQLEREVMKLQAKEQEARFFGLQKAEIIDEKKAAILEKQLVFCGGAKNAGIADDLWRLSEQLLQILKFYEEFEVDDATGSSMSVQEVQQQHYNDHNKLRKICFQLGPKLKHVALSHVGEIQTRSDLRKTFSKMPYVLLKELVEKLCFLDVEKEPILKRMHDAIIEDGIRKKEQAQEEAQNLEAGKEGKEGKKKKKKKTPEEIALRKILLEILYSRLERKLSQLDKINQLPLFPTEETIWDTNLVPDDHYQNENSLALPKLNLQFLTIHDYLLRNFHLFRLESTHDIRDDLKDVVARMKGIQHPDPPGVKFLGSSRYGLPIEGFEVTKVHEPNVGEQIPKRVDCEIKFSLSQIKSDRVRQEWNALREHDIVFVVTLHPPKVPFSKGAGRNSELRLDPMKLPTDEFAKAFGITNIRGAEVVCVTDEEGHNFTDPIEKRDPVGDGRTITACYDPAQYEFDKNTEVLDVEHAFHIVVRRDPKANNFKAVLETIRTLMNNSQEAIIPPWLHQLFLGYGDPEKSQYRQVGQLSEVDFRDTFLDREHVFESFAGTGARKVEVPPSMSPPYKLSFEDHCVNKQTNEILYDAKISASTYIVKSPGPYPHLIPNKNKVRFTPVQIEAIRSGVNKGLTMCVGPPGTGKTDTAVQIVNLLFHNFPDQKIVLVAHSNQALNDLFEKIVDLDIPERYLLRLGRGIDELDSKKNFSKWGRVDFMLKRRLELLQTVERLAKSLGLNGADEAYSCESAKFFFLQHVQASWELFMERIAKCGSSGENLHLVLTKPSDKELKRIKAKEKRKRKRDETQKMAFEDAEGELDEEGAQGDAERKKQRKKSAGSENGEEGKDGGDKKRRKLLDGDVSEHDSDFESEDEETKKANAEKKAAREKQRLEDERMKKIDPEWENKKYAKEQLGKHNNSVVAALFPFTSFFNDTPTPLFSSNDFAEDKDEAEGCYRYIESIFKEIDECLPFELLRNGHDRGNYLLTTHSRIIAMTCTHAALTRDNLVKLNFKYDTLIMEESAQILEVETMIPMLLQKSDVGGKSRLKRVCLIGDHHQLPPIIKNRAFQKFGRLDQSLFTRFIRLNVPHLILDAQGRARPSICQLYAWRYAKHGYATSKQQLQDTQGQKLQGRKTMKKGEAGGDSDINKADTGTDAMTKAAPNQASYGIRNLDNVLQGQYLFSNTGLAYDYQFINVKDYNGRGETTPQPHFYQNEGEAEYAVALFMFMRLMGYPAANISILTTYNGQRALISDVLSKRCAWNPLYGSPKSVTTVDKYQGQQNEYIILSLVRTEAVGHLRDVRRLIVAMSRSKFGLYIIGRFKVFEGCFELRRVFNMFKKRPLDLALSLNWKQEFWPATDRLADDVLEEESDSEDEEDDEEFVAPTSGAGDKDKGDKEEKAEGATSSRSNSPSRKSSENARKSEPRKSSTNNSNGNPPKGSPKRPVPMIAKTGLPAPPGMSIRAAKKTEAWKPQKLVSGGLEELWKIIHELTEERAKNAMETD